ncbi:hypothetical protein KFK09_007750 [Dendrobium nobile]|uniref:Uncharacterized protein n=1 Tax=Dendrobium nobile TaxID=94219 RepID=A0A8T3BV65_DENNO|nr:hypothetical protein KFK09_007750 [Dendrobium nobile]
MNNMTSLQSTIIYKQNTSIFCRLGKFMCYGFNESPTKVNEGDVVNTTHL